MTYNHESSLVILWNDPNKSDWMNFSLLVGVIVNFDTSTGEDLRLNATRISDLFFLLQMIVNYYYPASMSQEQKE